MQHASNPLQYTFSYQDAVEVLRLVRDNDSVTSFELEMGDVKLSIQRTAGGASTRTPRAPSATPPQSAMGEPSPSAPETRGSSEVAVHAGGSDALTRVVAPMLGIFYRSPSPGAAPFVQEGDLVKAGDSVGLIEVMKLFTTVEAECSGRIVRIEAGDNALVEHGELLMLIEPTHDV
jgi:acetyl-CoA carboxylase biotin carboxyl carrier protein